MKRNLLPAIGIIGAAIAAAVLWRRFGPDTYLRFDTMFGRTRVYQVEGDDGEPVRLLEVGGIVQSGTYLGERYAELAFEYLKRYDLMFGTGRPVRRVAVLGCGGYDYPEHLVAHHARVVVDAVEIDPAITAIARRYFFLDRLIEEYRTEESGRLNLICADALAFLEDGAQAGAPAYDAIVNDCFDAGAPPAHLTTRTFVEAVRTRLAPGGIYLVNIVAAPSFLRAQIALLESAFAHVRAFPCSDDYLTEPDNVIVAASDSPLTYNE